MILNFFFKLLIFADNDHRLQTILISQIFGKKRTIPLNPIDFPRIYQWCALGSNQHLTGGVNFGKRNYVRCTELMRTAVSIEKGVGLVEASWPYGIRRWSLFNTVGIPGNSEAFEELSGLEKWSLGFSTIYQFILKRLFLRKMWIKLLS